MKFFTRLVKGLALLLAGLLGIAKSVLSAIVRGRSVRLPQDTEAENVSAERKAVPPPVVEKPAVVEPAPFTITATVPWLRTVKFLILERVGKTRRMVLALPRSLESDTFAGLMAVARFSVRETDMLEGVRFTVDTTQMELTSKYMHTFPLLPASEEDHLAADDIREKNAGHFIRPTNIRSVELHFEGISRTFVDSGEGMYSPGTRQGRTHGCIEPTVLITARK